MNKMSAYPLARLLSRLTRMTTRLVANVLTTLQLIYQVLHFHRLAIQVAQRGSQLLVS